MPRIPLRRRLLDELEDQDRSFKRARLFKYLKDVSFENLLVPTSDGESDNSDTSSSTSSSTTTSSRDSDESASQGILSDLSEIEEIYIQTCRAKIDVLRQVILASRVLREHPPVKKASQIHLLEHWRNSNPNQYKRRVRVDPDTFDGIVNKIRDHRVFHNNSNVPQTPVVSRASPAPPDLKRGSHAKPPSPPTPPLKPSYSQIVKTKIQARDPGAMARAPAMKGSRYWEVPGSIPTKDNYLARDPGNLSRASSRDPLLASVPCDQSHHLT